VAFPVASTFTAISSSITAPMNVAFPVGEPTMKCTVSEGVFRASSRRLSTGLPYRSATLTAIAVVSPTVTSGSYRVSAITYGAA
jgi:hypothetical protein